MRFEFELTRKDWLKKNELLNGKTIPYGKWTLWLLLICSIVQVLLLWFVEQSAFWTFTCLAVCVWLNVSAFRRFKHLSQFLSYRTVIEFHDDYLSEQLNRTEYQKSYSFLNAIENDGDYFVFHHPGNSTFLPKRVMNDEQIDWALGEIGNRIANSPSTQVPNYQFIDANKDKTFEFEWTPQDLEQLSTEAFVPFQPDKGLVNQVDNPQGTTISTRTGKRAYLIPAAILVAFCIWNQSFVELPVIVFFLVFVAFNELAYAQEVRKRKLRTHDVLGLKTEFYVGDDAVWIGIPEAVDRHALEDIVQVHFGRNFAALQSHEGLLFVLARRAIGDEQAVTQFLTDSTIKLNSVVPKETGNPYQPPAL